MISTIVYLAGDILFVNLETESVIYRFRATKLTRLASFSPCGKFLALSPDNDLQIQEVNLTNFLPFFNQIVYV